MTTTPDNTATTWHDLIDQLTPDQIADLSRRSAPPDTLLFLAREFAAAGVAGIAYADTAPPPDAVSVDAWSGCDDDDAVSMRFFRGTVRAAGSVNVDISGWQYSDGRVERSIACGDGDMSARQARMVAALLLDAADELDALAVPRRRGGAL